MPRTLSGRRRGGGAAWISGAKSKAFASAAKKSGKSDGSPSAEEESESCDPPDNSESDDSESDDSESDESDDSESDDSDSDDSDDSESDDSESDDSDSEDSDSDSKSEDSDSSTVYGAWPTCMRRMCMLRCSFRAARYAQWGQPKGRSPVCLARMCVVR